ncbi:MAG: 23S rRNA (guanosine(2251)-2'-O)-methyltransferase RlmB [Bacteroidota bacterium]|nr:23S rRNA (guanosine(2251)-2'-O)-methyltransferase RlmB [Bacteroidota bacterium]
MAERKIIGINALSEALKAGQLIDKVFIMRDVPNPRIQELVAELKLRQVPVQVVPKEKMNRLSPKAHQGVIAFLSLIEYYDVQQLIPSLFEQGLNPLLIIMDGVTDVRNAGAIARSAECFGAHALIMPARGSADLNEDAVKSSAGALERIPVCRELHFSFSMDYLLQSGIQLIACSEKATDAPNVVDYTKPTGIVMGSEDTGIHPNLLSKCQHHIRIPMIGKVQSLNVSVAAGIVLYEACKGRLK